MDNLVAKPRQVMMDARERWTSEDGSRMARSISAYSNESRCSFWMENQRGASLISLYRRHSHLGLITSDKFLISTIEISTLRWEMEILACSVVKVQSALFVIRERGDTLRLGEGRWRSGSRCVWWWKHQCCWTCVLIHPVVWC